MLDRAYVASHSEKNVRILRSTCRLMNQLK
jgi:hypothetical protein